MNASISNTIRSNFIEGTSSDEAPDHHSLICKHCGAAVDDQAGTEVLAIHLVKECNSAPADTLAELTQQQLQLQLQQQLKQTTPPCPPHPSPSPPPLPRPPPLQSSHCSNTRNQPTTTTSPSTPHSSHHHHPTTPTVEDYLYLVRNTMHAAFADKRWHAALAPYEPSTTTVAEGVSLFLASPWIARADKDEVLRPLRRAFGALDFEDQMAVQVEEVGGELMEGFGGMGKRGGDGEGGVEEGGVGEDGDDEDQMLMQVEEVGEELMGGFGGMGICGGDGEGIVEEGMVVFDGDDDDLDYWEDDAGGGGGDFDVY